MKKSFFVFVFIIMLSGIYAFETKELQTDNIMVCKDTQYYADFILKEANSIQTPALKNPAIEKHVLKALEYLQECDLEHALNSVDALYAIVSQAKYENYQKNILALVTYKLRLSIIICYNQVCAIQK